MRRKHNVFIGIIVLAFLCICCGCTNNKPIIDENYIEAELQERYGEKFVVEKIYIEGGAYNAVCHPENNPLLRFSCMYNEKGSLGYDYYIGALIAKEETDFFQESIGVNLGECYIRGSYALIVSNGVPGTIEGNLQLCQLIKDGSFSLKNVYELNPITNLGFSIYINKLYGLSAEEEYDALNRAVEDIVNKYKEKYNLDLYVRMDLFFLSNEQFQKVVDYYEVGNQENDIEDILKNSDRIIMEMGVPTGDITEDLWLTKDDYIEMRGVIK